MNNYRSTKDVRFWLSQLLDWSGVIITEQDRWAELECTARALVKAFDEAAAQAGKAPVTWLTFRQSETERPGESSDAIVPIAPQTEES